MHSELCTDDKLQAKGVIFPFWGMMSGLVSGFLLGLGFVAWWFGPDDYTHSMALIHEGAGMILGGLIGIVIGLIYKIKRQK